MSAADAGRAGTAAVAPYAGILQALDAALGDEPWILIVPAVDGTPGAGCVLTGQLDDRETAAILREIADDLDRHTARPS